MSNKKEREKRREERIAAEAQVETGDRRTRILQIAAGAVFLAVVAVVVVIVVASSGSDSGGDTKIEQAAEVDRLLTGIPQSELELGEESAPVELVEFGDLQCPICKANSEDVLPDLIQNKIKTGEAKLVFRNFIIIGEESIPAGAAAIAAGKQGRGYNYIETFYRNQGEERSGYVTDEFLEAVAKAAGVKDLAQWNVDRKSKEVLQEVETTTSEASGKFGFTGTPSFLIKGPKTNGYEIFQNAEGAGAFEEAIDQAS
jgi:protein-disulfide isomerase